MKTECDYVFWLNRGENNYEKVIRSPHSLADALRQYIRSLPVELASELVDSIRYERINEREVEL